MTIAQWLSKHRQPEEVRRCFWEPLAVAIMNERLDRASAPLFLGALRQAFLRHRHDAALVFPLAGLSRLFADPAKTWIEQHGGEVRCGADVVRVDVKGNHSTGVTLKDGTKIPGSAVILAVPAQRLSALLPRGVVPGLSVITEAATSPISGIHLWTPHHYMEREALGLIGRRVQWVFRRENYLSMVISAAYEFVGLSNQQLAVIALEDLRSVFGDAVQEPSHSLLIRERKATFAASPENEQNRPGTETGLYNLFLAGDWTDTGLPATIEGAILSGQKAARLAAKRCN
jgi:squalene-associated FAD-dependent desaturase